MDRAIILFASIGIVLLWHRAEPLRPIREWLVLWVHRWWSLIAVGHGRVGKLCGLPLWWLSGVLGCGDCLIPYVGVAMGLIDGMGWHSVSLGLTSYATWVIAKKAWEEP